MSIGCCIDNPSSGGGGGGVTSVSGTTDRITSTGGNTPVIDIAATYVGQSSITTLGTITTGVWAGTVIGVTHGGTGTTTQFTQGSVIFAGASGVYSQANSGLFYDSGTVRLGIGTASPQVSLHTLVNDAGANSKVTIEQSGAGDSALQFLLTGVTAWVVGIDNSDSDNFKLAPANNGFASPVLTMTTGGVMTLSSPLPVGSGGTNNTTFTAYSVLCAGTTATGAFQNVSGVGSSGQVLTSNGAAALPTWQAAGGGGGLTRGQVYALASGNNTSF